MKHLMIDNVIKKFWFCIKENSAYAYCEGNPSFLSIAFAAGVLRLKNDLPDKGKVFAETAMSETIDGQETRMGFWLNMISVIAAISPMIGLLGTVSGMIKAFQKIGIGGMGKPEQLAGNIGEALVTTATGLVVGIPAMLAFFIFRGRMDSLLTQVADSLTELVDIYTGDGIARQAYEARFTIQQPMQQQYRPQAMPAEAGQAQFRQSASGQGVQQEYPTQGGQTVQPQPNQAFTPPSQPPEQPPPVPPTDKNN